MAWKTRVANEQVYRVAFSADGSRLAAAGEKCSILDTATGSVVLTLQPHQDTIWHLAFSPDGTQLATCSWDGTITITDTVPAAERIQRRNSVPQNSVPGY
jgi:WD40 repeat protein